MSPDDIALIFAHTNRIAVVIAASYGTTAAKHARAARRRLSTVCRHLGTLMVRTSVTRRKSPLTIEEHRELWLALLAAMCAIPGRGKLACISDVDRLCHAWRDLVLQVAELRLLAWREHGAELGLVYTLPSSSIFHQPITWQPVERERLAA